MRIPSLPSRMCLPAVALAAALLTACASGVVYVRSAPPAPIAEVAGYAPGPTYVWIGGHHAWESGSYIWVPGSWTEKPNAHSRWIAGIWKQHEKGWYWQEGHWK